MHNNNTAKPSTVAEFNTTMVIVLMAIIGIAVVLLLPLLVGSMVDYFNVTEREAGFVATAELTGGVVGTLLISLILKKLNWRVAALAGLTILAGANCLSILFNDFISLCIIRSVSGMAEGAILVMAYSAIARVGNQELVWSYIAFGWYAYSILAFYLFPFIFERWGAQGGYVALAVTNFIAIPFLRWFPAGNESMKKEVSHLNDVSVAPELQNWWAVVGIISALLFYVGMGAVWTYLDRIGIAAGISVPIISTALIISSFSGIGGACLSAWIGTGFGRGSALFFGCTVFLFGTFMLMDADEFSSYTIAISLMQFAWSFMTPYLLGILTHVDSSGRVIAFATVMQLGGLAAGPFLAALLLSDEGYSSILWLGGIMTTMSLILILTVVYSFERTNLEAVAVKP